MSEIKAGQAFDLAAMIEVKCGRISSKRLIVSALASETEPEVDWVLYAMDQGETISSETSPLTKIIHLLEGDLNMTVDGAPRALNKGSTLIVPANTWHDFAAYSSCKFLQISK